ncbi:MAG: hypothetical protein PGN29_17740 [Gordonia paraffinivorans]
MTAQQRRLLCAGFAGVGALLAVLFAALIVQDWSNPEEGSTLIPIVGLAMSLTVAFGAVREQGRRR